MTEYAPYACAMFYNAKGHTRHMAVPGNISRTIFILFNGLLHPPSQPYISLFVRHLNSFNRTTEARPNGVQKASPEDCCPIRLWRGENPRITHNVAQIVDKTANPVGAATSETNKPVVCDD